MSRGLRIVLIAVGVVVIVWLLFTVVFPWVERQMEDPTMEAGAPVLIAAWR